MTFCLLYVPAWPSDIFVLRAKWNASEWENECGWRIAIYNNCCSTLILFGMFVYKNGIGKSKHNRQRSMSVCFCAFILTCTYWIYFGHMNIVLLSPNNNTVLLLQYRHYWSWNWSCVDMMEIIPGFMNHNNQPHLVLIFSTFNLATYIFATWLLYPYFRFLALVCLGWSSFL